MTSSSPRPSATSSVRGSDVPKYRCRPLVPGACTSGRDIDCTQVTMAGAWTVHGRLPVSQWCGACQDRLRDGTFTCPRHRRSLRSELAACPRPRLVRDRVGPSCKRTGDCACDPPVPTFTRGEFQWLAKVSARAKLRAWRNAQAGGAVGVRMTTKTSIMTYTGRYFDPLNPTPESVHMPDVARGLRAIRFNGHLRDLAACPDPRGIDSHSMRVARLAWWKLVPCGGTPDASVITVLAALIHDAPEGYCQDRVRPLKTDRDREVEAGVLASIAVHLVEPTIAQLVVGAVNSDVVRWADGVALAQEAMLFQCGAEDWAAWPAPAKLAETLHLFWPREGEDWQLAVEVVANSASNGNINAWEHVGNAIGIGRP